MSPPRGGRSHGGPARKGKSKGTPSARRTSSAPGKGATSGKGPSPGKGKRIGGARSRTSSNTRVVWPPSERTETASDAIERLMLEAGLSREFPPAIEHEARMAATRAWADAERERRTDLRDLPTFTVDPATARDFDDAISAERIESDPAHPTVRVWVHIADVAAHVPLDSPLDLEARRRATSVYVPGAVEPMLPHALSSDACSLAPGVERLAVTVELVLRGAEVSSTSFYRSIIRSDMRLDYEQVDRLFAGSRSAPEPWGAPLTAAREAAAALQSARERSGALVIDSE
ncbi:MAG: RNB domain-containing ribonuclease, partial [Solirubrobacteraceae bacterium]